MRPEPKVLVALSALLGPGYPHAALAHEVQITRLGDNFDAVWSGGPRDNLVGGGVGRLVGGGDNAELVHTGPYVFQWPVFARLSGGGDDKVLTHGGAPPAASRAGDTGLARAMSTPSQWR